MCVCDWARDSAATDGDIALATRGSLFLSLSLSLCVRVYKERSFMAPLGNLAMVRTEPC